MIIAAKYGYLEIVKILLEHEASIDLQNDYGDTALIRGRFTIKKSVYFIPLILACIMGNTDIVEILVANNCNLNIKDNFGNTALNEGK